MVNVLILAAAAGGLAILLIVRLWAVLQPHHAIPRESLGLLIVAGSGGHTTEILRLVGSLSSAYSPRHYVIAESDEMSAKKIHSLELSQAQNDSTTECPRYHLHRIPRSREVRQSWLSSVFTTLYSMWFSFPLVHQIKPDLIQEHGKQTQPIQPDILEARHKSSSVQRQPTEWLNICALVPGWRGFKLCLACTLVELLSCSPASTVSFGRQGLWLELLYRVVLLKMRELIDTKRVVTHNKHSIKGLINLNTFLHGPC
ncbi:UDP-N-acetylglucosamine transferase subunit ALG14 isoform X1 [Arvicanthis niloticus]|uniref:UDP-N-acetylglucosamine transferase subunit ALG14 isoform X1 n=1 Tax=Arvicanthis niloticus TaxID=61156 RepID=UPI00402B858B